MDNIELLGHSGIKISGARIIYVDPYKVSNSVNDADFIFITHGHYDHYSPEDILKLRKPDTTVIAPDDLKDELLKIGFDEKYITGVKPNNNYDLGVIRFSTVFSYNKLKPFHPKKNEWVGYVITADDVSYYIAGDTDLTEEIKAVKCDVAFVPVGGTYTMNCKEAAEAVNIIKPKLAVPIHYGSIVGSKKDAEEFCRLVNSDIECKIMM